MALGERDYFIEEGTEAQGGEPLAESPLGEQVAESGFEPGSGLSRDSLPLVILAPSGQRIDEMLNLLIPLPSSSHPYSNFGFSSQGLVLLKNQLVSLTSWPGEEGGTGVTGSFDK